MINRLKAPRVRLLLREQWGETYPQLETAILERVPLVVWQRCSSADIAEVCIALRSAYREGQHSVTMPAVAWPQG